MPEDAATRTHPAVTTGRPGARTRGARASGARASGARLSVGFILARRFTLCAFANFIDVPRLAADEGDRSQDES